jgi:hypothetical protein
MPIFFESIVISNECTRFHPHKFVSVGTIYWQKLNNAPFMRGIKGTPESFILCFDFIVLNSNLNLNLSSLNYYYYSPVHSHSLKQPSFSNISPISSSYNPVPNSLTSIPNLHTFQ